MTAGSTSFDLVLEVGSDENVESIKGSVQEAVAGSLNVNVSARSLRMSFFQGQLCVV